MMVTTSDGENNNMNVASMTDEIIYNAGKTKNVAQSKIKKIIYTEICILTLKFRLRLEGTNLLFIAHDLIS